MYKKFLNKVIYASCILLVGLGMVLSSILFIEVIMRYVFNSSIIFVEELSRILLIWTGFIGAAIALHEKAHVGIDFVQEKLTGLPKRIVLVTINLLMILFCAVIFFASLKVVPRQINQTLPTLRISMFWPYLAIPVSMVLFLLQLGYSLVCIVRDKPEDLKSVKEMFDKRRMETE